MSRFRDNQAKINLFFCHSHDYGFEKYGKSNGKGSSIVFNNSQVNQSDKFGHIDHHTSSTSDVFLNIHGKVIVRRFENLKNLSLEKKCSRIFKQLVDEGLFK